MDESQVSPRASRIALSPSSARASSLAVSPHSLPLPAPSPEKKENIATTSSSSSSTSSSSLKTKPPLVCPPAPPLSPKRRKPSVPLHSILTPSKSSWRQNSHQNSQPTPTKVAWGSEFSQPTTPPSPTYCLPIKSICSPIKEKTSYTAYPMRASVPALQKTTVRPPEPHTSSFCSCDICGPDCPCAEIGCYYDSGNGCKCCVKMSRCRIGGYKYDINAVDRKRKNILRDKEPRSQASASNIII
ncbi:hypothetical protein TrVE_jg5275 [Triparma verrucosa]|uniref:Uncharacterized protein n=2 Tax=Triparma TaxID=722752 RepID=A0A9W7AWW8_9STRA|nr:hypothetical protein TrST_g2930 [Triparma strigata]GMH84798.1 hypothetical protein TrVE_jg5275 [Triparma verrucosa]